MAVSRLEPIIRRLPLTAPAERLFLGLFGAKPFAFWLDSPPGSGPSARYSVMGADPALVFKWRGRSGWVESAAGRRALAGDPLEHLQSLLDIHSVSSAPRLPFCGGAIGYLSYDLCRSIERIPERAFDDHGWPDCLLGFYRHGVVIDHAADEVYLCALADRADAAGMAGGERLLAELQSALEILGEAREDRLASAPIPVPSRWAWNFDAPGYCRAVEKAKEYIAAGEIYQVNLSQRFQARWEGDPLRLYLHLRTVNPAPYSAFLRFPAGAVLSVSPELFLHVDGDRLVTRPIKGTRPRHTDPVRDAALRRELSESAKDRAELLMIVDLERNDLGRVCLPGTVTVPDLWTVETHPGVHHLVATVTGRLAPGRKTADILRAAFPGGSITGAPKVRAMEIIEELEPVRRGVYTGAIGCFAFDGTINLNIAIRTFVYNGGLLTLHAGGGIVADSVPELEYEETLHKAARLLRALGVQEEATAAMETGGGRHSGG